jgi:hypothetical protein
MKKIFTLIALCYAGLTNAQVPTNGLVAEWKFTDGTVTDSVNLISGSAQLGAVSTTDRFGNADNAYDLPPAGYLTFGDLYDDITTGLNATFSFSFWVKFDVVDGTARYIIGKAAFEGLCSLAGRQFVIGVNTNNRIEAQLFGALTGGHKKYQSSGTVSAGAWTHIAVSVAVNSLVANPNSVPVMYINGVAQTVTSNEAVGTELTANGMDNGSAFFSAGRYNNNQGNPCATTQYLDGQFDDLRVYNRMLGSEEVTALYNEAAPVACQAPFIVQQPSSEVYICPGSSGTQVYVTTDDDGSSYQWQQSIDGNWIDIEDEIEAWYYIPASGTYRVVVTSSCGTSVNSQLIAGIDAVGNTVGAFVQGGDLTICEGESITIQSQVSYPSTYSWFPGGSTDASITVSPSVSTTYFVSGTGIVTGCVGTGVIDVTVIPEPIPSIAEDNGTLLVTNGPFASYQWYFDGEIIPSENLATYTPVANGDYTVMVNDGTCDGTSAAHPFNGIVTGIENVDNAVMTVSPNPFTDAFVIEVKEATVVSLFNVLGEEVLSRSVNGRTTIDAESLPTGIYFLRNSENAAAVRLVKH